VIGTLGATAFEDTISYMRLELPLMTYATQMQINLGTEPNCTSFYMTSMKLTNETSQLLCADPTFNFSDVFLSSFANLNIMLYSDKFNP
jgi:hypothetical protein